MVYCPSHLPKTFHFGPERYQESVLSLYHVCFQNKTQIFRLGSKCLTHWVLSWVFCLLKENNLPLIKYYQQVLLDTPPDTNVCAGCCLCLESLPVISPGLASSFQSHWEPFPHSPLLFLWPFECLFSPLVLEMKLQGLTMPGKYCIHPVAILSSAFNFYIEIKSC